jgi:dTDP-4-dehydrorhamnose 3,5-epimerase
VTFTESVLAGAFLIGLEPERDERGFFARSWSRAEFARHGLDGDLSVTAISFNHRRGTLRGLHYQIKPFEEAKLVRCTAGAIYDVIVDLRPSSPTYRRWVAYELSAENRHLLFAPQGFAHGFQTLVDDTEVLYQMTATYSPAHARGIPWDDAGLAIEWPATPKRIISMRDRQPTPQEGQA